MRSKQPSQSSAASFGEVVRSTPIGVSTMEMEKVDGEIVN